MFASPAARGLLPVVGVTAHGEAGGPIAVAITVDGMLAGN
jgi:hypothetical protein